MIAKWLPLNVGITGANGFIGAHLCEEMRKRGETVFALFRSSGEALPREGIQPLKADIRDADLVEEILRKWRIDAIFHLASVYREPSDPSDPFYLFENNVRGTLNVLRAAHLAGVDRIVLSSTVSVYGEAEYLPVDEKHPTKPTSLYGLSKLEGELYSKLYTAITDLKIVVLRYSNVFGPGQRPEASAAGIPDMITRALRNEPVLVRGATQTNDFVFVRDVVDANIKALSVMHSKSYDVFNIGSGIETSVRDVAMKILRLAKSESELKLLPERIPGSPDRFVYDISKAKTILGYQPSLLEDALNEYIAIEEHMITARS